MGNMQTSDKGNTLFDRMCHTVNDVFKSKNNGHDYLTRKSKISCGKCGHELKTYYCEEQLYVVECEHCGVKCLVEARSPEQACYKTMAYPIESIEDIAEEDLAVFFDNVPINDPPIYVGGILDCDLPENVACGMAIPFPGTLGAECRSENEKEE